MDVASVAAFHADQPSALHDLARAFRAGDTDAAASVLALVVEAVRTGGLPVGPGGPAAVVAMPGHAAGDTASACTHLLELLAAELGWPLPSTGALERVAPGPEGKGGGVRNPTREAPTLAWYPDRLPSEGAILLLDDVVRSGATLAAAIRAAPPSLAVRLVPVAVFRARA